MKTCTKCNTPKPLDEFGKNCCTKDGLTSACKQCINADNKSRYLKRKAYLLSHAQDRRSLVKKTVWDLKTKPCTDCKKTFHPVQMDFDHISDKKFSISKLYSANASIDKVMEEIKKCELVCANCHRLRTAIRGGLKI